MKLVAASLNPPHGFEAFLIELGNGENGFTGTEYAAGLMTLGEYLQREVDYARGINLDPGHMPSTTFWLLDESNAIAGMSRLRHRLTPALLQSGGHIGYYIRPSARGKGYGSAILRFTLEHARRRGIERALLTVNADNLPSVRVIEATAACSKTN